MASKPTGRPRGRPRKEKGEVAPKQPRGRPRKSVEEVAGRRVGRPEILLRDDEDRYAVAMLRGIATVFRVSDRAASRIVVGQFSCREVALSPDFIAKCRQLSGWIAVDYELVKRPGAPASIEGRAATLRRKANQARDAADLRWLYQMGFAFACTFGAKDILGKAMVMWFAESVGEKQFAINVLFRAIDAEIGPGKTYLDLPPDFSTIFSEFPIHDTP